MEDADVSVINKNHYNTVTDTWELIFGDNFHFGYFEHENTSLQEATQLLVEKFIALGNITKNAKALDIGCGIGKPAIYIHEKTGCDITGISNSEKGIEEANRKMDEFGIRKGIRFEVRDALNTGLGPDIFDIVFLLESSHLIHNKERLFRECYRMLANGGTVILCDIIKLGEDVDPLRRTDVQIREGKLLTNVFGEVETRTLSYYKKVLIEAGFSDVQTQDISSHTIHTMQGWRKNIYENRDRLAVVSSEEKIEEFLNACDILEEYYRCHYIGYGFVKAVKKL